MITHYDLLFVLALYVPVNIAVFLLYAYDKHTARTGEWRIPERILLVTALFGPFGAFGAMQLFRHKTQKIKFWLVPCFTVLHIAVILYFAGSILPVIF